METINKRDEIEKNIECLESYRRSTDPDLHDFYIALINLGKCFIPYRRDGHLYFAPSRFVGYVSNDIDRHGSNRTKDGSETNRVISRILDCHPAPDDHLEQKYLEFCVRVGATPSKKERRYWPEG